MMNEYQVHSLSVMAGPVYMPTVYIVVDTACGQQVGPQFPQERHAKDFAEAMNEARKRREQRGEW